MATIDLANRPGDGINQVAVSGAVRKVYTIAHEIDLAAAVTAKGSALAAADVIQAIDIPANTAVLHLVAIKTTAMTGTSTDLTFDIGVTGVDPDVYVDGWDYDAAVVGTYGTPLGVQTQLNFLTAGTIDILIATQTGTLTGGKVKLMATLADIEPTAKPGIAQLGS